MSHNLTLHILVNVPYSNLNRDDAGTPKRVMQGGALRALHSSQSIKRGIRTKYEEASQDLSVRSGKLIDEVIDAAKQLSPESDVDSLKKDASKLIGNLTKRDASAEGSERSAWLSREEIVTAAQTVLNQMNDDFIADGKTGSLAIAAFGRMFANAPNKNTEAALAVSPGVTTHAASIDSDYFSTVDDVKERNREPGATFLSVARYVNGTFYRSITIDKAQLKQSWSGFDVDGYEDNLRKLLQAIVYGAPRGKENSTAPYTLPSVVLAEEQRYRTAYSFETPVQPGSDGGYERPSIEELATQYERARRFDPGNFGPLTMVTGTAEISSDEFSRAEKLNLDDFIDRVVDWIAR